jgi:hypothetical protein
MPAVDWLPTQTALVSALTTAPGVDREIGRGISARLGSTGRLYDLRFTPEVDGSKTENVNRNNAELSAWTTLYRQRFADIDSVGRWAEGVQVAANSGQSFSPYLQIMDGRQLVLAPSTAVPHSPDDAPAVPAQRVVGTLRVAALDPGTFGNTISFTIADTQTVLSADPAFEAITAQYFRLSVSRDGYVVVHDPMLPRNLVGSALVRLEWTNSPTRPSNGNYGLSGGRGNALPTLRARLANAVKLPALTTDQRRLVQQYVDAAATIDADRPAPSWSGVYGWRFGKRGRPVLPPAPGAHSVRELEDELLTIIAEAQAWLAAL